MITTRRTEMEKNRPTTESLLEDMAHAVLELESSDRWLEYLRKQATFHNYSGYNTFLIWMQRPDATKVAGYRTWQALGRQVRKGETGIGILAPVSTGSRKGEAARRKQWKTEMESWRESRAQALEKRRSGEEPNLPPPPRAPGKAGGSALRFRKVTVFDISQTDGDPIMGIDRTTFGGDEEMLQALVEVANGLGFKVELNADIIGATAWVKPTAHEIAVSGDRPVSDQVVSLLHELAHVACGHWDRFKDGLTEDVAEFEAESAAFVASAWLGIDATVGAATYLASWSRRTEFASMIKGIASQVGKAAQQIIGALETPITKEA